MSGEVQKKQAFQSALSTPNNVKRKDYRKGETTKKPKALEKDRDIFYLLNSYPWLAKAEARIPG